MPVRARLLLCPLLVLLCGWGACAQEAQPSEYQIKAAFLFNFAKFVNWPADSFARANSPLVFGILGDNPFHDDLARTIHNKNIDEHPLVVKEYSSVAQATNCHILFISASEKGRLRDILKALENRSVLTVSEMDKFVENGGMINFVIQGSKIRLEINNEAASKARLKISSKLLSIAARTMG